MRLSPDGAVLEHQIGGKDVAVRLALDGTTAEHEVATADRARACLDEGMIADLQALVRGVEASFPDDAGHDFQFAFEGARVHLLQRRAITR